MKLSLFPNADYADRCNDRRSVSGVAVMLGNTAVSASRTTQHCVTLSTSEVEYVAVTYGAKTVLELLSFSIVQVKCYGCHVMARSRVYRN